MSPRHVAVGAAALLGVIALVPLLPRSQTPPPALTPSVRGSAGPGAPAGGPGQARPTPRMRAEIERVVAAGRAFTSGPTPRPAELARHVRCADLAGQRYCLRLGWTTATQAEVRARVARAARSAATSTPGREATGDLDLVAALRRAGAQPPGVRAREERAELTAAARSVTKVWLLRHDVQGVPLPAALRARYPGLAAGARAAKSIADYPRSATVLRTERVREQFRSYWCGPATMQMIAWGWGNNLRSQAYWARKLGTTTSGTGIVRIVRVINRYTGWDREDRAGTYVAFDIGDLAFWQWVKLTMRQVVDRRSPLVYHPVLLKRFYPYLDDDASGHFQVGRGYDKNGDRPTLVSFFEPWNQQRFDPSEPYIDRVQWRMAYKSYRANKVHFQHNIGV